MKWDCFLLVVFFGIIVCKAFLLFVTSSSHLVQSFLDCLLLIFLAPSGLLHLTVVSGPGPLLFSTEPGWVQTQTGSGVILLMFTYICMSVHHSKVKCTWVRITYFINLFGRPVEM